MRFCLNHRFIFAIGAVAALCLGTSRPAFAGGVEIHTAKDMVTEPKPVCDPRFYIKLGGGVDIDLGNDFSNSVREGGFVFGDPGFGLAFDLDIKERDYSDVYEDAYHFNGEIGYALTRHLDVFATFNYTTANSQFVVGSDLNFAFFIDDSPVFGFGFDFVSQFGNYESWGGELGLRYHLFTREQSNIRPYIQVSGGATHVDAIDLHAQTEFLGETFTVYDGPFYDESTVWTASGKLGVDFVVNCWLTVGLDVGAQYRDDLDANDEGFERRRARMARSSFAGALERAADQNQLDDFDFQGFENFLVSLLHPSNDNGASRWTLPVGGHVSITF